MGTKRQGMRGSQNKWSMQENKYITLYTDERGAHQLAMPDGTMIPAIGTTIVAQTVDDALRGNGFCTVVVVLPLVRIASPDESKRIDRENKDPHRGG